MADDPPDFPRGRVPVVVAIDVEPDRRRPDRTPAPFAGFEATLRRLPALRDRLAGTLGEAPRFTWALRMDPQISEIYGSAEWVAARYGRELSSLTGAGDELGVHPHNWRWDGDWLADNADPGWVEHCVGSSLEAFRRAFGRPCLVNRTGDRFMSGAVMRQLRAAGVRVDLSLEPGMPLTAGLDPHERTTGAIPDGQGLPTYAFHPDPGDFRRPWEPTGGVDELLVLPLTTGVTAVGAGAGPDAMGVGWLHGVESTLVLWADPSRFEQLLERRLRSPELTHLAFALRSDIALHPELWDCVETNLAVVAGVGGRWLGPVATAELLGRVPPPPPGPPRDPSGWVGGIADPGHRHALDPSMGADRHTVEWQGGTTTIACPACGSAGDGDRIGRTRPLAGPSAELARCRRCRSVAITDPASRPRPATAPAAATPPGTGGPDPLVDGYVEYHASIDALASLVARAGGRQGARVLEIGCGYGFGLDIGRFAWGWRPVGIDPGPIAARGRHELGFDLRPTIFTDELDLGDQPFEVVVASEVIEHVPDPVAFLAAVLTRMAPDGLLLLTTPDAGVVDPSHAEHEVLSVVGAGEHVVLFSEQALGDLLGSVGFEAWRVERNGSGLWAIASPSAAALEAAPPVGPVDIGLVRDYCSERRDSAPSGSALRLGMAARAARAALHTRDMDSAELAVGHLGSALGERYGLDLHDPSATVLRCTTEQLPVVVADAHHTMAMLLLLHQHDGASAAAQFRAAAAVAGTATEHRDPSLPVLRLRSMGYEAIALSQHAPDEAVAALERLHAASAAAPGVVDVDAFVARAFTDLVAHGNYSAAGAVAPMLVPLHERLGPGGDGVDDEVRRAALDAVFSRAMLAFQLGDLAAAASGFDDCARLASAYADDHARHLVDVAAAHARMAADRLEPAVDRS